MKKTIKIVLTSLLTFILLILVAVLFLFINHKLLNNVKVDEHFDNETGFITSHGRGLYDKNGDEIILKGVNIGALFVTEGWISPYAVNDMTWNDSSNHYDYDELSQEQFLEGFYSNPNLTEAQIDELLDIYYKTWFTDYDAKIIKELGLNTVRIPFYYKNILNEENGVFSLKSEEEAFKYLDMIIDICEDNGLYVIIDLHGCPGSQNAYEHSGAIDYDKYDMDKIRFWYNETYIKAVVDLWDFVSEHYKDNKTIAMYDLINEPRSRKKVSDKTVWEVYDRIYTAIRDNGDKHNIALEGIWSFSRLPNPKKYEWENVTYSYHFYNWKYDSGINNTMYYMYQDMNNIGRNYNVPVYVGEFTFFDNADSWKSGLEIFDERHYSWTLWTYKMTIEGHWWQNSWGLINLYNYDDNVSKGWHKVNVSTATYDEIKNCFLSTATTNTDSVKYSNTYNYIKDYFNK
ncbi:MAG: cellulase family glycosylhydrolase [Gammaproteobacteria bacterium]|nr:cellulase family glycosylhydrolase [Gammaproteobacteria bacterium]